MYAVGLVPALPLMVVALLRLPVAEAAVLCLLAPPVVKLKGEQPTKLGAEEFTAAHSWMLNWMAA